MASSKNYDFILYILLGVVIGVFLAPEFNAQRKQSSDTLLQYAEESMNGRAGEIVEIQAIPGTDLSVIRVLFEFEQPHGGLIQERIGAIVENSKGLQVGSNVSLVDVAHWNSPELNTLWGRYTKSRDFEPIDNR